MTFQQFVSFLYSDAGRAAFGAAVWAFVGWLVGYVAGKRHLPDISNDDKRIISLVVVTVVTLLVQVAAISAGYASNTLETWFQALCEIGFTGVVIFTITKTIEGRTQAPEPPTAN